MSRLAKRPLKLLESTIAVSNEQVEIAGKYGSLNLFIPHPFSVKQINKNVKISYQGPVTSRNKSLHGLYYALLKNAILGTSQGFTNTLILSGIGYKVREVSGNLEFSLGFSHPVIFPKMNDVTYNVLSPEKLQITSFDKQLLGLVTSRIKSLKKIDVYKAKGIFIEGKTIKKKKGKSVK